MSNAVVYPEENILGTFILLVMFHLFKFVLRQSVSLLALGTYKQM